MWEDLPGYVISDDLESRLSDNSKWILENKYLERNTEGDIVESPKQRFYTVAKSVAGIEEEKQEEYAKTFYEMMSSLDFLPGGRILSNAGTNIKSLFNCYVLDPNDNLKSIFDEVRKAAIIHSAGGGTGYNFSKIRPRGSPISTNTRAVASGPVSFMEQYDMQTEIINSGNRRGANMGILDVDHPDILEFIYAKSSGKLTNFNVSVGATNDFMKAVKEGEYYKLRFNGKDFTAQELMINQKKVEENKLGGAEVGKAPKPLSLRIDQDRIINNYTNEEIGRVNKGLVELHAPKIMSIIAGLAWAHAEPGVLFLDTIDGSNPLPGKGRLRATNPCGEQPLLPYGACDLGSINLKNMVVDGKVDYEKIERVTRNAVRFLDNVNDLNEGPLPEIEKTVLEHRRIGLGVMGWADMLMLLGVPYGSEKGRMLAEKVMGYVNKTAYDESKRIGEEKGNFPAYKISIYNGSGIPMRNPARTTIAPTGSIAMLAGVCGGIEPYFSNVFYKNIRGGEVLTFINPILEQVLEEQGLYSDEMVEKIRKNKGSVQGISEIPGEVREVFKVSHDLKYEDHVLMQASFQKHVDNAVSKTINLPKNATISDVKKAYLLAFENGLKGITIYRDGSLKVQVLETERKKTILSEEYVVPVKVPRIMDAKKIKDETLWGKTHISIVYEPKTEKPLEIFPHLGKAGDVASADLEAISRLASIVLRAGVDPEEIVHQLKDINSVFTSKENKSTDCTSLGDALGTTLEEYMTIMKCSGKGDLLPEEYFNPVRVPDYMPALKIKQNTPWGNMHVTFVYEPGTEKPLEIFAQLGKSGDVASANLEAISRLASIVLRTGVNPDEIIKQLRGIGSNITSMPSIEGRITSLGDAVSRALEKYLYISETVGIEKINGGLVDIDELSVDMGMKIKTDGGLRKSTTLVSEEMYGEKCPVCGNGTLVMAEGCMRCETCSHSVC